MSQIGRPLRHFRRGEIYHIVQRGHNRSHIYESETSKAAFINMLLKLRQKYQFRLLYYVLMDNHYHLILQMQTVSLSRVIQRLNWHYCRYYNKKYKRTGTAFDGRFAAYHVKDERQFMSLIHYIAHNPVKADMVANPVDYFWGAHHDILTGDDMLIDLDYLMKVFHPDPDLALAAYHAFIEGIPKEIMQRDDARELQRRRRLKALQKFAHEHHFSVDFYDANCLDQNRAHVTKRRYQFITEARLKGFTSREIATYLGVSLSLVSSIWRSVRRQDPALERSNLDP